MTTVQAIYDQLRPADEPSGWNGLVDGEDLHELFFVLCGDMCPRGATKIDPAAIRKIAEEGTDVPPYKVGVRAQQAAIDLVKANIV